MKCGVVRLSPCLATYILKKIIHLHLTHVEQLSVTAESMYRLTAKVQCDRITDHPIEKLLKQV